MRMPLASTHFVSAISFTMFYGPALSFAGIDLSMPRVDSVARARRLLRLASHALHLNWCFFIRRRTDIEMMIPGLQSWVHTPHARFACIATGVFFFFS